jgi:hypothetical protein
VAESIVDPQQAQPAAGIQSVLYKVPALTKAVVSSIAICNLSNIDQTFRLSIAPGGAADVLKQYLNYDSLIPANGSYSRTEGWTLAAGTEVRVYSASGQVAFSLFLVQET